jgi:hypothetical protein
MHLLWATLAANGPGTPTNRSGCTRSLHRSDLLILVEDRDQLREELATRDAPRVQVSPAVRDYLV